MVAAVSGSLAIAASDSPQPRQYSAPFDILSLIVFQNGHIPAATLMASGRPGRKSATMSGRAGNRRRMTPQHFPSGARARARARGHQLGEHMDRHARAAKHRIPAHDLAYQPILGRRLGERISSARAPEMCPF